MLSINDIKENDIINRWFYYLNGITKIEYFEFDNILLDEKSNKNISV